MDKVEVTCKKCGKRQVFEAENEAALAGVIGDEHGWKEWSPRHKRAICPECMQAIAKSRKGKRRKGHSDDKINFTWGMAQDILNDLGYLQVTGFMLDAYTLLGLTRTEFLCLIHLARHHYNSERGESRPGLETIAEQMGYKSDTQVRRLVRQLEEKGVLVIEWRKGYASKYDASPFAKAAYELWLDALDEDVARELRDGLRAEAEPRLKRRPEANWGEKRYVKPKKDEEFPF